MKLFPLPSGDVFCHVSGKVKLTFDDAQAFCQDIGLRGLAEAKTHADYIYISGVYACNVI